MLAEGGMSTPFLIAWPGTIPGGQVYEHPVSALDVAATAVGVQPLDDSENSAKASTPTDLDGVNLLPYLTGENKAPPHDALYWRWMAQSAVREGNWKLLRGGDREYLYDLATDREEKHNLAAKHPEIATRLRAKLKTWADGLTPPGMALGPMAATWNDYFDHYLEGKIKAPPVEAPAATAAETQGWEARNGKLTAKDGLFILTPDKADKPTFITKPSSSSPVPSPPNSPSKPPPPAKVPSPGVSMATKTSSPPTASPSRSKPPPIGKPTPSRSRPPAASSMCACICPQAERSSGRLS
jgi:hypothetical protein